MPSTELINLNAYCGRRLLDPDTRAPIELDRLCAVVPPSLAAMELSDRPTVPVPEELRGEYRTYRPTPLFEARRFAEAIGARGSVLVKDEGVSASRNHKMNSALWIAYHCARDGVPTITTETTGNWGLALALACRRFEVRVVCFIDRRSVTARPDRVGLMERAGAEVVVVGDDDKPFDPLVLSADRAVRYTLGHRDARYIFGSVYNYFTVPQTIIGIEAREELGGDLPDVVVGSCGGGANLLGIAAAFLVDRAEGRPGPDVVCAEADLCPIVSKGRPGHYSIDGQNHYPLLETYGLDRLLGEEYIGGLGSTIVAAPVAHFHEAGMIATRSFTAEQALAAARLFERTEGRRVALETGYQLAAVIREARERDRRRILVNISKVDRTSFA